MLKSLAIATIVSAILATVIAVGGSMTAWKSDPAEEDSQPHRASLTEAESFAFANGLIEGATREVDLRFEISGRLKSLAVREGQRVAAGETLARLDAGILESELARAEASLERARAERERLVNGARQEERDVVQAELAAAEARTEQAQVNYQRTSQLQVSRAISQQQLDDARAALDIAQAEWAAARARAAKVNAEARTDEIRIADAKIAWELAQVERAQAMLRKAELRAPVAGTVLRIGYEQGEQVGPDSEDAVVYLADTSQLRVRAYVEEYHALEVAPDQRAYVVPEGAKDSKFWGPIVSCSPTMRPKSEFSGDPGERVDIKVREIVILLDPHEELDELVVGLPMEVFVVLDTTTPANPVPKLSSK